MLRVTRSVGRVGFVFTDRFGGVSAPPYDQLNLGAGVGDDAGAVRTNRRLVAEAIGLKPENVSYMRQVHGADVARIDGPQYDEPPAVDAMVTTVAGQGLAVLVADCVPVLLADPDAGVIGVAHAGRRGLVAGVLHVAMQEMRELGARKLVAMIGPAACGRCYEVPEEMRTEVSEQTPETWAVTDAGTPALDLPAGVAAQLRSVGADVETVAVCSIEDASCYSYRRDMVTGRMAGIAWLST